jgi:hypothetical protein
MNVNYIISDSTDYFNVSFFDENISMYFPENFPKEIYEILQKNTSEGKHKNFVDWSLKEQIMEKFEAFSFKPIKLKLVKKVICEIPPKMFFNCKKLMEHSFVEHNDFLLRTLHSLNLS